MNRRVLAYHVIFGAYGFWLPNDPRGSWSDAVYAQHLKRFGDVNRARGRRSVANEPHDESLRRAAKEALLYPPVRFTGLQAQAAGAGFAEEIARAQRPVFAAAIMPDHVHLVVARSSLKAEVWAGMLKRAASRELRKRSLHPFQSHVDKHGRLPTPWSVGGWKVFLFSDEDIARAIAYVNQNPLKAGLRQQRWSFVTPFAP